MIQLQTLFAGVVVSFAIITYSFNIVDIQQTRSTTIRRKLPYPGPLYLFDTLVEKREDTKQRSGGEQQLRSSIPDDDLAFLENGFGSDYTTEPPFPYRIDLSSPTDNNGSKKQASRLIIRHLEDKDITTIMPEIIREFGSLKSHATTTEPGDELAEKIENYLFSLTVLIGLTQRVVRREKGYCGDNSACPDHNVICLVEQFPILDNNSKHGEENNNASSFSEQIVGIAELSWQPPNPNRNAPPFVLPYFMKTLISRFSPSREENSSKTPTGYISNVLVWKTHRGRGYSRILMAALEGIAKQWGCEDVRLHVDADEISGRVARSLYWGLGYEGVPDRGTSRSDVGYGWMGPNMANQGLYLVDGLPLLYLCKSMKAE